MKRKMYNSIIGNILSVFIIVMLCMECKSIDNHSNTAIGQKIINKDSCFFSCQYQGDRKKFGSKVIYQKVKRGEIEYLQIQFVQWPTLVFVPWPDLSSGYSMTFFIAKREDSLFLLHPFLYDDQDEDVFIGRLGDKNHGEKKVYLKKGNIYLIINYLTNKIDKPIISIRFDYKSFNSRTSHMIRMDISSKYGIVYYHYYDGNRSIFCIPEEPIFSDQVNLKRIDKILNW